MTETTAVTEPRQPKKSKKKLLLILGAAVILGLLAAAVFLLPHGDAGVSPGDEQWQEQGAQLPSVNYYSGIIEPQETWNIQKDASREIDQIFVTVGQTVSVGQQLFSYKTEELDLQLKQYQLEMDGLQNEIDGYNAQIKELTAQRQQAPNDQQLQYTVQIQEMQTGLQQAQLNRQMKQVDMDNLRKSIDNAVVTSTMEGVVKQINDSAYYLEQGQPFMTVLALGAYQVKATVDEMNVWQLSEGMSVTIRSRLDQSLSWPGTVTKVDTENPVASNQNYYYYESTENQASKYYFYVALNTGDELLLGQHVYVEVASDPFFDDEYPDEEGSDEDGQAAKVPLLFAPGQPEVELTTEENRDQG